MSETVAGVQGFSVEQANGDITHSDYLVLAGAFKRSHPGRGGVPLPEFRELLQSHANEVNSHKALFVVRDQTMGGVAVGGAALRMAGNPLSREAQISEIFIHPRVRGRSLGRMLLDTCIRFAEDEGADLIVLTRELATSDEDIAALQLFTAKDFQRQDDGTMRLALD